MTQRNISEKEADSKMDNRLVVAREGGRGWERDALGISSMKWETGELP